MPVATASFVRRWAATFVAAAALGAGQGAAAAAISVAPVLIEFDAGRRTAVLEVAGPSAEPVTVQVRLFRWSQSGGEDVYEPTDDIGFSPPMFQLPPGGRQVVRLLLRAGPPAEREAAYRVFVDEIPGADRPGAVQMQIRMILPLFVAPREPGGAVLQWRGAHEPGSGLATVTARNTGSRRVRLQDLAYLEDGRAHPIAPGLSGYVLAGEGRSWSFPAPAAEAVELTAATDTGALRAAVSLSPP
ncbi:MAG TPA: molecular chaperone [Caulobacteraceae bacterium]|nr:molecular chaperone [Caulobacteraceae bacterium]